MKPGMPWSVKGIDQETREAAKDAARRSGMTLGEWLNTMILDQSDEAGEMPAAQPEAMTPSPQPARPKPAAAAAPPPPPPQHTTRRNDSAIRLEEIAEQLAQLARREQETAPPPRPVYAPPSAASEDAAVMQRVLARIDTNERQTVEAFTAVNERLAALGKQMMAQAKDQPVARAAEPAALKSLEQAVRNIVEHIELSEKRSRENMRALQERIVDVASRPAAAPAAAGRAQDDVIAQLHAKYEELVGRVERSERRPETGAGDQLRAELGQLAERIDHVRATAEQLASRAQTAAVQTSQRELHEIEGRILGVLKEAQAAFGSQGTSAADIQKLRGEIGTLNQRIDQMRTGSASERDVSALRTAVEQLQGRVAQAPDMRPLADMDRRLNELARRLDQQNARPQASPELDRRLAEIDARMKDLARLQADPRQGAVLERKVSEMADRVAYAESKLSHIDTIERAVNQLFESIDHNRNWAKEAAEDAANRMAQKLLREIPQATGGSAAAGAHSAELMALEDGLRAVRESARHADQRNQETLEAVHETLEHIINKLAELETAAVGHQLARATLQPAEAEQPLPAWQDEPAPQEAAEPHAGLADIASAGQEEQASGYPQSGPQDDPIPQWQSELPPAEKIPGQAAADDYIAAARKAALAAAQAGMSAPAILPEPKSRGGFLKGLSIGRKRDVAEAAAMHAPRMEDAANAQQGGVRRTLLLAGVVLLMAVGAFWINSRSPAPKTAAAPPPANAQQQPQLAAAPQQTQAQPAIIVPNDVADNVVTGSVSKPDATLQSLVAEPGTVANQPEMPPSEIGTEALRLAARDGNTSAQFIVATRYLDGNGIEADLTQAAHWYQKSAEAGLAPAQYRLATLFERGRGVPKDASTAFVWYKRAAEQGNVKSMHNVAVLAAGNEVGAPNYELAHKWFLAASQHGLKDSQFNLALLYERGLGTAKNASDALFWYMIAAANKDQDAAKRVAALSAAMPAETVDAIRRKAETWVPEQGVESANVVSIKDPAWQDGRASLGRKDRITDEDIAADLDRLRNMGATGSLAQAANISQQAKQPPRPRDPLLADASIPVLGDANVGQAQHLLLRLGYDVGTPSGILDTRTTNAIRLFEFQTRQRVTGRVTEDLLHQLQAFVG